ncbi:MAG: hypothetical protein KDC00_01010 [Flavobacteriales bacterium]|nr:hypothetical protein [Flavobacteriales bacterium]
MLIFDILPEALCVKAIKSNPMTTTTFRSVLTSALMVLVLATVFTACNKEDPTTVVITVKDADGRPAEMAYVRLFANPAVPRADASRLLMEAMTDAAGNAEFDYSGFYEQGQAGFAVLDILTFRDSTYAEGIIKVLEEETNEETLILKPMDE